MNPLCGCRRRGFTLAVIGAIVVGWRGRPPDRRDERPRARMFLLDQLAEACIARARDDVVFDDLPGRGRPLALDDDAFVPTELRPAFRLLRNAGYLPEDVRLHREIASAEDLLQAARTEEERAEANARLRLLLDRLGRERGRSLMTQEAYLQRVAARLGDPDETA